MTREPIKVDFSASDGASHGLRGKSAGVGGAREREEAGVSEPEVPPVGAVGIVRGGGGNGKPVGEKGPRGVSVSVSLSLMMVEQNNDKVEIVRKSERIESNRKIVMVLD